MGEDFLILSDADVVIQQVKKSEVIDGETVIREQQENAKRAKYARKAQKMANEKLLEVFCGIFIAGEFPPEERHEDHELMLEELHDEIIRRMDK